MADSSQAGYRIEEISGPEEGICASGTARAAFVGRTLRGPVGRPLLVRSFADFQQTFGGLWQPSTLAYAVEQFFDNGGREALVVRVVNGARPATLTLAAGGAVLEMEALQPGTREFLRAAVDYDNVPADAARDFNLTVQRVRAQGSGQVDDQEIFRRVSMDPAAERYLANVLRDSRLVRLARAVPVRRPDATLDPASGLATAYVASNPDGDDGAPLTDYDVIGSATARTGLFALDEAEHFNFLCIPPLARDRDVSVATLLVAARFCRERRALLIVDPPAQWQTADEALRGMRRWEFFHDHAVMYFPRILAHDKLRGHFESFAPCGAVAGMLARSDEVRPPWAPPRSDEILLRPGHRPACLVPEQARERLATTGVNTLASVRSATRVPLAARTLAAGTAASGDWQLLGARRLALFILDSVARGTRWAGVAPRGPDTRARLEAQVREFLGQLHRAGAFGDRPLEQSFFVVCDERAGAEPPGPTGVAFGLGWAAAQAGEFHAFVVVHGALGTTVRPASAHRLTAGDLAPAERDWVESLATALRSAP